jgi:hypothetical protein
MFNWLGEMLGTNEVGRRIRELEDQVSTLGDQVVRLEDRVTSLERSTTLTLEDFGLDFGQFKIFPRFKFPHLLIASE